MQDRVNFATEVKRSEYEAWKSRIMSRIGEMETGEAARLDNTETFLTY